ncbi:hypothetical protein GXM_07285 [Nostoc sphaeroides CCNUC1]|uniref:Uncharacterized protein n=1 Tax=Nostoc sphaeroides CCNUC1 TaxID=2653204 RepID=A0A5P8WB57_9NOSO|nr:hypothetical protein GXM_07285 [Nostoc sphaeroides CCNUC1]
MRLINDDLIHSDIIKSLCLGVFSFIQGKIFSTINTPVPE